MEFALPKPFFSECLVRYNSGTPFGETICSWKPFEGEIYLIFLRESLSALWENVPLHVRRGVLWFHHDGAPPYCCRRVTTFLNEWFMDRWIGRYGPILSLRDHLITLHSITTCGNAWTPSLFYNDTNQEIINRKENESGKWNQKLPKYPHTIILNTAVTIRYLPLKNSMDTKQGGKQKEIGKAGKLYTREKHSFSGKYP